ncbi:hypothetical protein [Streptomyces specialis]|uniref:hypothetical protein n=1 Tax=Streptomyces specialis TaxID=498367 RepID=UPI00131E7632|nr:hypothetical protein [Streptomyces specialis]
MAQRVADRGPAHPARGRILVGRLGPAAGPAARADQLHAARVVVGVRPVPHVGPAAAQRHEPFGEPAGAEGIGAPG